MEGSPIKSPDFGKMKYGCKHYRRRCSIRAPCCDHVYSCRHCHQDHQSTCLLTNSHNLVRQEVQQVVCLVCDTEQTVAQVCTNCGVRMGEYYCHICKFFDDDVSKQHFHCDHCGICRIGGSENYFHCQKCRSCYSVALQDNHLCVENSMRHNCLICFEYLFDSLKPTAVLKCGHTMHAECHRQLIKHGRYSCPICSKSMIDMSTVWKRLDEKIEATIMPEMFRNMEVWIHCNDCSNVTRVGFHTLGHKCCHCNSYNTRGVDPPSRPQ